MEPPAVEKPHARAWLFVYGGCVVLAIGVGLGLPGAIAPLWLAVTLPAALAAPFRRDPSFSFWIGAAIPAALAFWSLSAGGGVAVAGGLLLVAVLCLGSFYLRSKGGPSTVPLLALTLFVALVAYLSGSQGGSGPMTRWLLAHSFSVERAHTITIAFRKTVHFTFYGTVGWTALRAARAAGSPPRDAVRTALLAALALASFDELRQTGYADRTGSAWDVLLDLSGSATFVGLSEWRRSKTR